MIDNKHLLGVNYMKKSILATLSLGFLALIGTAVFSTDTMAQSCHRYVPSKDQINFQRYDQQQRINQGIRSGELTPFEAARLRQKEAFISRQEAFYGRKGFLTPGEKAQLNRELNNTSKDIYIEKHDSERVYRHY